MADHTLAQYARSSCNYYMSEHNRFAFLDGDTAVRSVQLPRNYNKLAVAVGQTSLEVLSASRVL